jgi:hypothetical protein
MKFSAYKVGDEPLKVLRDLTLFENEKCIVKAYKDTLTLPVTIDENTRGYIFFGSGQVLIDSIVETSKGAVGKPTVKNLAQPFLMLGKPTEEIKSNLSAADISDLNRQGLANTEAFVKRANEICQRIFNDKLRCTSLTGKTSVLLAFVDIENHCDILVAKEDKLVYSSKEKVFVFKDGKGILTSPNEILLSGKGKRLLSLTIDF